MEDQKNKRKFSRIQIATQIKVTLSDVDARRRMFLENLSAGGFFLRTDQPRPVGTKLSFEFSVRDGGSPIQGTGIVRWIETSSDEMKGMGIKFVEMNDEGKNELRRILELRKK